MTPGPDSVLLRLQEALAGRFAVERELGRGGMGIVYLARDLSLDRPVAIKVLQPALATRSDIRARFLQEARTAARLSHPNIVPVHAVEEHDDLVCFVMAYVEGETLGDRIRRAGPVPAERALVIMREAAWALAYAHQMGVVHRDVKPDNILLEQGTGRTLVSDFGIAQLEWSPEEQGDAVVGTVWYMSPEQQNGQPLDGRSDLYSLGLTIRAALTGEPRGTAPLPAVPTHTSLAAIIARCLATSPQDRYATGEGLAGALGDVLGYAPSTPAAVRNFLAVLRTFMLEVSSYVAIVAVLVAWTVVLGDWGGPLFITASFYALLIMAGLLVLRSRSLVGAARGMLDDGLIPRDAWRALEREDSGLPEDPPPSTLRRVLEFGSGIGWVFAAGWWAGASRGLLIDGVLFAALTLYPVVLLRSQLARLLKPRQSGWWARLWKVFEWKIFGMARLTGAKPPARPEADRTEAILGSGARRLFGALPPELPREFAALPDVVARLERQAEHLGAAGGEAAAARRRSTLLALESVRLEVLRLAAGAETSGGFRRDLGDAEALSRRIGRLLADAEAAAGIDATRTPLTPV